ncbi:hypothetical protein [Pontibacillus salipaludis]|uniref:Uncharacterized protein n=1 Tax=Pontibacillus salipaludis TaxID=1697394 RepID=A0ABQ1QE81_9BACI|nr:hypothetical protein [Pontibacillus salipaludis]GGD24694.1 hypothetical protein GCM10011389_35570 [Pontibacillus salipaludis]
MKWYEWVDLGALTILATLMLLYSQNLITDHAVTLVAAPVMFYIMIISKSVRKRLRRKNRL